MNPELAKLQTYPFQKLSALLQGTTPNPEYSPIALYIGEPKHPTPQFIKQALINNFDGLAGYPLTAGMPALRQAISKWIKQRYQAEVNPDTQIIPVNGSREALFAFVQAVIDPTKRDPVVVCPNPFYQIYEGAAILAHATPRFLNSLPEKRYAADLNELPTEVWARTQILITCSPGNPTGAVMGLREWKAVFDLSDKYGFVIASDECYSEIYFKEGNPPLGALDAARQLGRTDFERLIVFSSLSKRSNVPGMRSGFVAGDANIIKPYLLYRTYHGCAMSGTVQAASTAAWGDEKHVVENRRLYREKFDVALSYLKPVCEATLPDAAFYLWLPTPIADTEFARRLYIEKNVSVLPGSYLAREAQGINPGKNRIRVALVSTLEECAESARRIAEAYNNFIN
ncbi:MAG: succinyldiaminopimelate transaminase [Betaproteobacteria bacterium]|nr:succinyldiaminopimelate transaminase [Betaproteobacteria bacterium]